MFSFILAFLGLLPLTFLCAYAIDNIEKQRQR